MTAARNQDKVLNYTEIKSPLGGIILGERNGKICMTDFKGGSRAKNALKFLAKKHGAKLNRRETPTLKNAKKQLSLYFSGKLSKFDLPLEYAGTGFQETIWKQLMKIPFGRTVNYGAVAEKTGNPKAARAAGAAIGKNRISIIIPCHRVIGKNGSLTGFGGGLRKKEWLLKHERAI
ncbi:MAG: methylated-DNA--[protein]-cysteine S-methyltransferase [Candidatus Zixiibacteriota bacterium]|nr:MAG: methylated-DNA--[protein]-cysteine S-methyltransferase [candidate division Zixibacteria bacterium]